MNAAQIMIDFSPLIPFYEVDKHPLNKRRCLRILDLLSEQSEVPKSKIIQFSNDRELVFIRHMFYYLCRHYSNYYLRNIGEILEKKNGKPTDHTTVKSASDNMVIFMSTYTQNSPKYCNKVRLVSKMEFICSKKV